MKSGMVMKLKTDKALMASLVIIAILTGALVWIITGKTTTTTGSALQPASSDYEGYGSYEEMMAAHHGGSAGSGNDGGMSSDSMSGLGGCGGEGSASSTPGNKTSYGITYDNDGYNKLLEYEQSIQLSAEQKKKIAGLNVQMPCCGYAQLDPDNNCGCGHHVASLGLAKLLASKGWSTSAMQTEMNKWIGLFYPESGGNMGGC